MFLRRILLSGIATIALGGAAIAATTSAAPDASSTPSYTSPANPGAANALGATSGMNNAGAASGTAISAVADPKTALKSASVQASDGTKVGKVTKVHVDSSGQAQSIDVKVGAKTVSLPAAQASFDESNKIVVAQLTASDIKKLPAPAKASSATSASPAPDTSGSPAITPNNQ